MASQKRGQRPAARPSAPLIVACTAGAVLVGAGALFARLRFCRRCEAATANQVLAVAGTGSNLDGDIAPEGQQGQVVHAHGLELQVYRPWQLEPCVAAPEAQERSGSTHPSVSACGAVMKAMASEPGDLRRSLEDDTAVWDIIAPRPAAAAPIASAAVAVASCVLPPLDYAEVLDAAPTDPQPLDTPTAAVTLAPLLLLAPVPALTPAPWFAAGDTAGVAVATSAAAACSAATAADTSDAHVEEQSALAPDPAPCPGLAGTTKANTAAAYTAVVAVLPQPAAEEEAAVGGCLEAESSWDPPQSWCGDDSEGECELLEAEWVEMDKVRLVGQEEEEVVLVDANAYVASEEADSCDGEDFFSKYENAAFIQAADASEQQERQEVQQRERLPGAPATSQSAFAAYRGGNAGALPFAPCTPCASFHMRDNDVFDASADTAPSKNQQQQQPSQLPRVESFAPATPALLSACPSLARADSLLTAAPAPSASRSASLRSPSCRRTASARRALWLDGCVCAEEQEEEAGGEPVVAEGVAFLVAAVEAALVENPLFADAVLPAGPRASQEHGLKRSSLEYVNPCYAAEGEDGEEGEAAEPATAVSDGAVAQGAGVVCPSLEALSEPSMARSAQPCPPPTATPALAGPPGMIPAAVRSSRSTGDHRALPPATPRYLAPTAAFLAATRAAALKRVPLSPAAAKAVGGGAVATGIARPPFRPASKSSRTAPGKPEPRGASVPRAAASSTPATTSRSSRSSSGPGEAAPGQDHTLNGSILVN
eukprot:XP_001691348.1 predicted protein [Chlamydomonas reinhardtii]